MSALPYEAEQMDWLDKVIEKLREWLDRVVDTLVGPRPQQQPQPIPIPVHDHPRR